MARKASLIVTLALLAACDKTDGATADKAEKTNTLTVPSGQPAQPSAAAPQGQAVPGTTTMATGGQANVAGQPGNANAVAANANAPAMPTPDRESAVKELQARLDGLSGKVDALKKKAETPAHAKNAELKKQLTLADTRLDAVKADLKGLAQTTEATFAEAKGKVDKDLKELETLLESSSGGAGN